MKHTPGPWTVAHDRKLDPGYYITGSDSMGSVVCELRMYRESPDEWMANANLIAAAPELAQALRECLTAMRAVDDYIPKREGDLFNQVIEQSRTVLAKVDKP